MQVSITIAIWLASLICTAILIMERREVRFALVLFTVVTAATVLHVYMWLAAPQCEATETKLKVSGVVVSSVAQCAKRADDASSLH